MFFYYVKMVVGSIVKPNHSNNDSTEVEYLDTSEADEEDEDEGPVHRCADKDKTGCNVEEQSHESTFVVLQGHADTGTKKN